MILYFIKADFEEEKEEVVVFVVSIVTQLSK